MPRDNVKMLRMINVAHVLRTNAVSKKLLILLSVSIVMYSVSFARGRVVVKYTERGTSVISQ